MLTYLEAAARNALLAAGEDMERADGEVANALTQWWPQIAGIVKRNNLEAYRDIDAAVEHRHGAYAEYRQATQKFVSATHTVKELTP